MFSFTSRPGAFAIGTAMLVCLAAAAPANTNANANRPNARPGNQAATSQASPTARICVREGATGSRVVARVCKTRAEWIRDEGSVPGEDE